MSVINHPVARSAEELLAALAAHPARLHLDLPALLSRAELHELLRGAGHAPLWAHTAGSHLVNAPWVLRDLRRTPDRVVIIEAPHRLDTHELRELLAGIDALAAEGCAATVLTTMRPLAP